MFLITFFFLIEITVERENMQLVELCFSKYQTIVIFLVLYHIFSSIEAPDYKGYNLYLNFYQI